MTFREETALRLLVHWLDQGQGPTVTTPQRVADALEAAQMMATAMCEKWGHRGFTSCDRCGADITKKKGG